MRLIKNIFAFFLIMIFALSLVGFVEAYVTIQNPLGHDDFDALLTSMASEIATFVGALSVTVLIIAGILFLISSGDPEKVQRAKKMLTYAIIGIAIALAAQAIINTIENILNV